MRKLSALAVITSVALSGLIATPASAAPTHDIKPLSLTERGKVWTTLDAAFKARPNTKAAWLAQGDRLSPVGFSRTATSTYPMRSVATKNGFYVFAVAPSGKDIKVTAKQYKNLKRVLPSCKTETSLNCYWEGTQRGNKRGKDIVNFQYLTVVKR